MSRLDARDAGTPMKSYLANVSRTISLIDATDGSLARIVKQDVRRGNQGAAFHLWTYNRTSTAFLTDDLIVAHEFGGGPIVVYSVRDGQVTRALKSLNHPVLNIATSHDGRLVAASGNCEVSVIDVAADKVINRRQVHDIPFLQASFLAFSTKNRWLAVGETPGVQVSDLDSTGPIQLASSWPVEPYPLDMTFLPDDSLLVASADLRQYDLAGNVVCSFSEQAYRVCTASADGMQIAASTVDGENVEVYNVPSGKKLHTFTRTFPTALAYLRSETELAIGGPDGTLTLVDTVSGRTVWTTVAPGRYRLPWAVPGMALIVWCYIGYRISRAKAAKATAANTPAGVDATTDFQ